MVRKYIRKTAPPSYSREQLQNAVDNVKQGVLTIYRAAKLYNIPKATLFKHVKGQRGIKSKSFGRPTTIPLEDEKKIADCLKTMAKWGFGLSKKEMLEIIGRYVKENNIVTRFKDGVPGDDFFVRFRKSHKLSLKNPQAVEVARKKSIDPFIIDEYYQHLKEVTLNVAPTEIWNLDETSFCLDPSRVKVLGPIGTPTHRATSGPGRENITVLLAANAAGEKLPPLIVFKGKNVWDSWMSPDAVFEGMSYSATQNGWMEAETFMNFFTRNFLRNIHPQRPVVLIYDGHSTHVGLSLVLKAREENVTILKLPPHTSHVLQPLDLSVFRPMKIKWDEELVKWQRQNYGKKLPKSVFSSMIGTIWKNLQPEVIKNGFEKAGIFPFSDRVIPPDKFEPEAYQRWLLSLTERERDKSAPKPSTSREENITLPSRSNNAEQINSPSTSVVQESVTGEICLEVQGEPIITPIKSFEALLLEQVKQGPNVKAGRKRVCPGAEVITSDEALKILEAKELEKTSTQKPQFKQKKKPVPVVESDEDEEEMIMDDASDVSDELEESLNENNFMDEMNKNFGTVAVDDWVIVKLATKKTVKLFVAQIMEKEPSLYVKFARRIGLSSSFHWPNIEDSSVITPEEIFKYLPSPVIDKRGRINFNVRFDSYNLS